MENLILGMNKILSAEASLVDELGQIKAQMAELEKRESAIKKRLIEGGLSEYEGTLFRVTVAKSIRIALDTKAIRAEMGAKWCDDHSTMSEVTTVRVGAR